MPTYRYFKLHALTIPGGNYLEIGEFNLTNGGTRVSGGTLSSSDTPTNSLSYFDDGNTATRCYWTESTAEASGFYVQWDFGTATAVDGCKFCGFDTDTRYPDGFTLSGSNDGTTWTALGTFSGISYPGNQTFTSVFSLLTFGTISGNTKDASGANFSTTLYAYDDATGALVDSAVSNASTGNYSFTLDSAKTYTIEAVPPSGKNAKVLRGITPVT